MLTAERMYQAILDKDVSFEGIFVTAVKTTGIFCKPSCTARKPKRENVEFYSTPTLAMQHGYRPCKVCQPMLPLGETPTEIQKLLDEIAQNPFAKIKDCDIATRGLEPHTIRRWFKKHHNMTFQAYQRMMRVGHAFTQIHEGESITASAFDVGYNSLSGFNTRFREIFEKSPRSARYSLVIYYTRILTPLGPMLACASPEGICLLEFLDRRMLEQELRDIMQRLDATLLPSQSNIHLLQLEQELQEYFAAKRTQFSCALHAPASEFQTTVWKTLQTIPFGQTISYKQQSILLGMPNAVRAVAHANGMNRIAILIPCHRVIGENGALKGYGGGVHRKKWLLDFEQTTTKNIPSKTIF
ncbi:MAG: methylated-DNA--[protein]-cysteine S-methyltransferase [Candidatus Kapabacteria bacterium]|jgi:AraC family transcriptional regulator of adaptative response/methylated-DNA-[protein]-cysteine methyltransferase|nr:methylated-DNA--[protein]-cysteine S-methyltransferase [Candidatus Kapabacteria bacterium]